MRSPHTLSVKPLANPGQRWWVQDPIHGCFRLDPVSSLIFDSRQFQRLRRLKQLGLTYMVFPGVSGWWVGAD